MKTNEPLDASDLEAQGWIPTSERLPPSGELVFVRQGKCFPCSAWLDERNEWRFIEYQHPRPDRVTHWKRKV